MGFQSLELGMGILACILLRPACIRRGAYPVF